MSTPLFYDLEREMMAWLKATFPALADPDEVLTDQHVGTETPADLQDRFPFARVEVTGGPAYAMEAFPTVDVDVFDSDRHEAYALAEAIRAALLSPPVRLAGARIDNVENSIGPRRLPWDTEGTVRFSASYSLTVRRR